MAAVYDAVHAVALLYGGRGGGQFYSDTWAWNGQTWRQVASADPPAMFGGPVAAFDPVMKRPLLFGMVGGGTCETWSWDGSQWQRLSPSQSPDCRESPSMALDPTRGQLMLFGGISLTRGPLNDTWSWDGTTWNQLAPKSSPPVRFRAMMGSSAAKHIVVLWGGVAQGGLDDAWKWDGANWSQIVSPGMRADGAVIDTGAQIIFFGGDGPSAQYNDVQTFDGAGWSTVSNQVAFDPAPNASAKKISPA